MLPFVSKCSNIVSENMSSLDKQRAHTRVIKGVFQEDPKLAEQCGDTVSIGETVRAVHIPYL